MAKVIEGLAAAYSLDHGGDVIQPGAFRRTLEHWRRRRVDRPVPLIDAHDYSSVRKVVGHLVEAKETPEGLWTRFQLVENDPDADATYRRFESGALTGLSIGYRSQSRPPTSAERTKGVSRVLTEIALQEVSAVPFPQNEQAMVTKISDGLKTKDLRVERLSRKMQNVRTKELRARIDQALARKGKAPARVNG